MHAEEIYRNLDDVALAHLDDWLGQGSLLYTLLMGCCMPVGVFICLITNLLRLVSMNPDETLLVLAYDIQLVSRHVLLVNLALTELASRHGLARADNKWTTRLQVQLVCKVGPKAFIEVLRVVQNLTD